MLEKWVDRDEQMPAADCGHNWIYELIGLPFAPPRAVLGIISRAALQAEVAAEKNKIRFELGPEADEDTTEDIALVTTLKRHEPQRRNE